MDEKLKTLTIGIVGTPMGGRFEAKVSKEKIKKKPIKTINGIIKQFCGKGRI